jgi:hypothetical protein
MRWRAIPLVTRARLRREWAAMAVLALLFGLAGGAVLAALASAHRAETSYDRPAPITPRERRAPWALPSPTPLASGRSVAVCAVLDRHLGDGHHQVD